MTPSEMLAKAKAFMTRHDIESWRQEHSAIFIALLAREHGMPRENLAGFAAVLKMNGLAGNASQFRQKIAQEPRSSRRRASDILDLYGLLDSSEPCSVQICEEHPTPASSTRANRRRFYNWWG